MRNANNSSPAGLGLKFKMSALVLVLIAAQTSLCKEMPRLPAPLFADTEVTAHHPLDQTGSSVRTLDFWLSFDGTPSNNVEVAFGNDADADGALAPHETDVVVGWDCGSYFIERFSTGERIVETNVGVNCTGRMLDWHYGLSKNRAMLESFSATNEVGSVFSELSSTRPSWLYGRDWNLMRLTARGIDVQNERFLVDVQFKGLFLMLR